jgi:mRNA interferase YafQ
MLDTDFSHKFKKDFKKFEFNKQVKLEFKELLKILIIKGELAEKYRDHPLSGDYLGYRECHIRPDVLLIYKTYGNTLYLARIGSHSELFR